MRGLLAIVSILKARRRAVRFGLQRAVLCAVPMANFAACGGYGVWWRKRACLVVSWDGGVHAGGRQGLKVVGLSGNNTCTVVRVGMVDSGAGTTFPAVPVSVFELGLV